MHFEKSLPSMSAAVIKCWVCYKFTAPTLKAVVRHIGRVHSCDPNFQICCSIEVCTRTYTKFSSLRSHLYRKHSKSLGQIPAVADQSEFSELNGLDSSDDAISDAV